MDKMKKIVPVLFAIILGLFTVSSTLAGTGFGEIVHAESKEATYRNVMYYGDWSIEDSEGNFFPKDIPAEKLTHLNFAFLDFDVEGNLEWTDEFAAIGTAGGESTVVENAPNAGLLNALQELRLKNNNLKVGVSVGGWTKSGDFALNAQNETYRKNLVTNLVKFVEYNQMDFLDIDWEYPGSVREPDLVDSKNDEGTPKASEKDRENFVTLLKELRAGLETLGKKTGKDYELSVALAAGPYTLNMGTDIAGVFEVVDFANLMTYDIHGAWENTTNHHSGLYTSSKAPQGDGKPWSFSTNDSVNFFLNNGATPEKIVIGAAFYSRGWGNVENDGPDPEKLPGLFGSADFATTDADGNKSRGAENEKPLVNGDGGRNGGIWAYRSFNQLKEKYSDLTEYWDDESKASYMYSESSKVFFTYDSVQSIQEKTKYIREKGLGGVITWMQSQDKPSQEESEKRDTLTTAIYDGLYKDTTPQANNVDSLPLAIKTEVTPLVSGVEGYKISITNEEILTETDNVLKAVEKNHKTIKNPVLSVPAESGESFSLSAEVGKNAKTSVKPFQSLDLSAADITFIAPGETVTFDIYTDAPFAHMKRLTYLNIGQRILPDSVEYGTQQIYKLPTSYETVGNISVRLVNEKDELLAEEIVVQGEVGTALEMPIPAVEGYKTDTAAISETFKYSPQSISVVYTLVDTEAVTGKVVVQHVDGQGKKLAEDVELVGVLGAAYETAAKTFAGYKLEKTPENAKGKFTAETQQVIYGYEKQPEETTDSSSSTSETSSSTTSDSSTPISSSLSDSGSGSTAEGVKKPGGGKYPETGEISQGTYQIMGFVGLVGVLLSFSYLQKKKRA
ncbi:glycosyl hydrolase family 18 protein [Enterococcus sp. BWR-S5]|uniref:glycosyl hydrolase family 18 protein n=1 Tax=Enterococcus sp. BWR-S5 TaxID=2787714 RepID=UPI001920803D|nr:glycosyl hydrolase family 18 protein [Enterococcus sp. BWR-S5]MBL1223784.1 MucBP domain-containing protein [Enterococcus sp. BWR-S5]